MKMNIPVEELSDIAHFQNRKQVPLKSSWVDKTHSTFLFLNFADSVNTASKLFSTSFFPNSYLEKNHLNVGCSIK